jgi:hypothetical protein
MNAWLEQQKAAGAFQGEVLGPLGLEITVHDAASHSRVIEAVSARSRRCVGGKREGGS